MKLFSTVQGQATKDRGLFRWDIVIVEAISPTLSGVLSVDDVGRVQNYVAPTKTVPPQMHLYSLS